MCNHSNIEFCQKFILFIVGFFLMLGLFIPINILLAMDSNKPILYINESELSGDWFSATGGNGTQVAPVKNNSRSNSPINESDEEFSLGQVNADIITLKGPVDWYLLHIYPPKSWIYSGDGQMRLNLDLQYGAVTEGGFLKPVLKLEAPALLEIWWNEVLLSSLSLTEIGKACVDVKLPLNLLQSSEEDSFALRFAFYADQDCIMMTQSLLTIQADSLFRFPHQEQSFHADLSKGLTPFWQPQSLVQIPTWLVIPDVLTDEKSAALLNFAAAYGAKTSINSSLRLIRESELTNDIKQQSNLIFVGETTDFPLLEEAAFSIPLKNGKFVSDQSILSSDGVLQLVVSPWNSLRGVFFIGGNSQEALTKSIAAFSSGLIRFFIDSGTAVVTEQIPSLVADTTEHETDQSFIMSGMRHDLRLNSGENETSEISFTIPFGRQAANGASVALQINYPETIDLSSSFLNVYLNDEVIAAIPLEKGSNTLDKAVKLPLNLLRSGRNVIGFEANFLNSHYCETQRRVAPWLVISNRSILHLPLESQTEECGKNSQLIFSDYPSDFLKNSELSNLLWVLPDKDLCSLQIAADLASEIGAFSHSELFSMKVAYADQFLDSYDDNDWIVIGQVPELVAVLLECNDLLPVPFTQDYSKTKESSVLPAYILNHMDSFGYVEMGLNPYDISRSLLLITGTDEEGLQSAAGVFSRSRRSDISGNYASIGDGQVFSHIGNLKTPTPAAEFLPTPETRHSFLDDSEVKMVLLGAMLAVVVVLTVLLLRKRNNKNLGQ